MERTRNGKASNLNHKSLLKWPLLFLATVKVRVKLTNAVWHPLLRAVGARREQRLRVREGEQPGGLGAPVDAVHDHGRVGGELLGEVGHVTEVGEGI